MNITPEEIRRLLLQLHGVFRAAHSRGRRKVVDLIGVGDLSANHLFLKAGCGLSRTADVDSRRQSRRAAAHNYYIIFFIHRYHSLHPLSTLLTFF